ncbi:heparanase-like [Pomacea canaliculata]|uniref:heparanase-like n=1 Tax=Pomacea canaliculata TaxID=400727 RepID=UPI000D739ABB|nr:heparanase-like [Pomacea canaliculata]XP_025080825.1 heparanase-like [Pomacea canaliculata]
MKLRQLHGATLLLATLMMITEYNQLSAQFVATFDINPSSNMNQKFLQTKEGDPVNVILNLQQSFSTIGKRFLGVTIDTSLARNGMKTFNFSSSRVQALARALTPCFLRFGGTSADCMTFEPSLHFVKENYKESNASDGYTKYVPDLSNFTMPASVWDRLNAFAQTVGWDFIMDLNALHRHPDGSWDPTNAAELLQYSSARNYSIAGFELGNEYDLYPGGLKYNLSARQLAKDVQTLQKLLSSFPLYSSSFIIGPETAGLNPEYFMRFLYEGGDGVVKASSSHFYYFNGNTADLGSFTSVHIMESLRTYLQNAFSQTRAVSENLPLWLSETSSAYNSGAPNISDRFVAGFLWLDKLGLCAELGVEVVLRQTFFDLNYALIDHNFDPNPDFWLTLLFKRLIWGPVFMASGRDDVRVYAACGNTEIFSAGALVVYLLNPNNYTVDFDLPQFPDHQRLLYILTPGDEDGLLSKFSSLNGVKLEMRDDTLPPLNPVNQQSGAVTFPSFSFGFVVLPSARVTLCTDRM